MSIFESGGSVFEDSPGGVYNAPSMSGDNFEGIGAHRTVEDDVLDIQAGGARPLFPRATPGIPYTLGQFGGVKGNKSDWIRYQQLALVEAAKFKKLSDQANRVTCPVLKQKIVTLLGKPSDDESPAYRYSRVIQDIADSRNTAMYGSSGYMEYSESRRQNRVDKLVAWNRRLAPMVDHAIKQCGLSTPGQKQPTPGQKQPAPKWAISAEQALKDAQVAYSVAKNTKEGIQIQNFWYKSKVAVDAARTQPMSSWKRPVILGQAKALLATAEKMLADNRVPKPAEPKPEVKLEPEVKPEQLTKAKLPMGLILGGGAAFLAVMMLMMQRR